MGQSKRKKEQFFAEHPFCCFCGGLEPATTQDHQPGRLFFERRMWPEGFVFPACAACNGVSRDSEKALAVLIHGDHAGDNRHSYTKNLRSFASGHHQIVKSMIPSSSEVRKFARTIGITKPHGATYSDLPVIKLDRNFWTPHFDLVFRKIGFALHYQCFRSTIPKAGGVSVEFWTNADTMREAFNPDPLNILENICKPVVNTSEISSQFSLRYAFDPDAKVGAFFLHLHEMIVSSLVTSEDKSLFSEGNFHEPFSWN